MQANLSNFLIKIHLDSEDQRDSVSSVDDIDQHDETASEDEDGMSDDPVSLFV